MPTKTPSMRTWIALSRSVTTDSQSSIFARLPLPTKPLKKTLQRFSFELTIRAVP